jgi:hypothetical protein
MTTTKEELLASTIRKQIVTLEGLLQELADRPEKTRFILERIHEVEAELHRLRDKLAF